MIAAILLERNLQSVANYLIVSLAVADLMVACLVMPFGAVYEVRNSPRLHCGPRSYRGPAIADTIVDIVDGRSARARDRKAFHVPTSVDTNPARYSAKTTAIRVIPRLASLPT